MFFSYDRDVNRFFTQAKRKLETTEKIKAEDFFYFLTYPKHWQKYSHRTQIFIIVDTLIKLQKENIGIVITQGKDSFLKSLIYDDNIYIHTPRIKK